MASHNDFGSSKKRSRITKACDACRGRRRKCDGKTPCSSCLVYSTECTFTAPTRKRGPRTRQQRKPSANLGQRLKTLENIIGNLSTGHIQFSNEVSDFRTSNDDEPRTMNVYKQKITIQRGKVVNNLTFPDYDEPENEEMELPQSFVVRDHRYKRYLVFGPSAMHLSRSLRESRFFRTGYFELEPDEYIKEEESSSPTSTSPKRSFPSGSFSRTPPPRCSHNAINRLVSIYFQSVHPMFPMVDREILEQGLVENNKEAPFLLLVHSICLTVLPQVRNFSKAAWGDEMEDVDSLEDTLGTYVRTLLGELFDIADLLVLQACINIVLAAPTAFPELNGTYYISVGHRMAMELGMHRDIDEEYAHIFDKRTIETMKRTWYCLYLADKYSSAVEGRLQVIREDEYCTPLPDMEYDPPKSTFALHVALVRIFGEMTRVINCPFRNGKKAKPCHPVVGMELNAAERSQVTTVITELNKLKQHLPNVKRTDGSKWGIAHHLKFLHSCLTAFVSAIVRLDGWSRTLGADVVETLNELNLLSSSSESFSWVLPFIDWFVCTMMGLLLDLGSSNLDLVKQMYPFVERLGDISLVCKVTQPMWQQLIEAFEKPSTSPDINAGEEGSSSARGGQSEDEGDDENDTMDTEDPVLPLSSEERCMSEMGEEIAALLGELNDEAAGLDFSLPEIPTPPLVSNSPPDRGASPRLEFDLAAVVQPTTRTDAPSTYTVLQHLQSPLGASMFPNTTGASMFPNTTAGNTPFPAAWYQNTLPRTVTSSIPMHTNGFPPLRTQNQFPQPQPLLVSTTPYNFAPAQAAVPLQYNALGMISPAQVQPQQMMPQKELFEALLAQMPAQSVEQLFECLNSTPY
ncbi:hypothetical protein BJ742DRAFT_852606 [Cladochytrium replicatum]|nr:hypothetical protein BJ742DRAFT_852606 [Cladochytrium replicatum]